MFVKLIGSPSIDLPSLSVVMREVGQGKLQVKQSDIRTFLDAHPQAEHLVHVMFLVSCPWMEWPEMDAEMAQFVRMALSYTDHGPIQIIVGTVWQFKDHPTFRPHLRAHKIL